LADTTPTIDAITTRAIVATGIIQLTASAIVNLPSILHRHVTILEDITIIHLHHTLAVLVTTTVSTVLGLLSIVATAIRIVPITAVQHAQTLAVFTATCTVADIIEVPAALYIHGEPIIASMTPSTVLGK